MTRTFCVFLLLSTAGWAQTETSVTVTSTRSISLQPSQAILSITVTTPLSTSLDDVLGAIATSGVTAANLSTVDSESITTTSGTNQTTLMLQWLFSLPVSLSKIKTSLGALATLQQSVTQKNAGWSLTYSASQVQVSDAAQAANPCSTADLLAGARAQAQKLASASPELSIGPILAMSDGAGVSNQRSQIPAFFVPVIGFASLLLGTAYVAPAPPPCALTVKFALLHYQ